MAWVCPECNFNGNHDDTTRCACGYELSVKEDHLENLSPYQFASMGKRFSNLAVDQIAILLMAFVTGFLFQMINFKLTKTTNNVLALSIYLLYYSVFEATTGRTCGKFITGTKALRVNGNDLTITSALLRTACRFIPFDQFSFFASNRGWHDKFSRTIVVDLKKPNTATESVGQAPALDVTTTAEPSEEKWF